MQKQWRVKDTRFRLTQNPKRDKPFALYRAEAVGNPSWWFMGFYPSAQNAHYHARKYANRPRTVISRSRGREGRSWDSALAAVERVTEL